MSDAEPDELVENAVAAIRPLLEQGEMLSVAYSGGKDSTATLICAVEALRRVIADGHEPLPLAVQHNNTRIENPEVEKHAFQQLHDLQEYALDNGLPIEVHHSEPSLADSFAVKVVGGLQLPNFADSKSRMCSTDWKVRPGTRRSRQLLPQLRERAQMTLDDPDALAGDKRYAAHIRDMADATDMPVLLVGTRAGESAQRARRTAERGEMAKVVREVTDEDGKVTARSLSPILDWDEEDVWEVLSIASDQPDSPVPAWRDGFADTVKLYRDSGGGECVIAQIGQDQQRSAGCGARHGCSICLVTGQQDKSLGEMLRNPAYAHLRPIMRLRSWLIETRGDYGRRSYVPRKTDGDAIQLEPGGYDAQTCAFLLQALASIDLQERERADRHKADLEAGRVPMDPELQRAAAAGEPFDWGRALTMAEPQFQFIGARDLIAIDYQWSLYGLSRKPFHALKLYTDVLENGAKVDIPERPEVYLTERPAPAAVELPGLQDSHSIGLDLENRETKPITEQKYLEVDTQKARRIIASMADPDGEIRRLHDDHDRDPTLAARFYLSNGVIQPAKGQSRWLDTRLRQTEKLMEKGVWKGMPMQDLFQMAGVEDVLQDPGPAPEEEPPETDEPEPLQMALGL